MTASEAPEVMSPGRRARIALLLSLGFYAMEFGVASVSVALYYLVKHYASSPDWHGEGIFLFPAFFIVIMSIPSIRRGHVRGVRLTAESQPEFFERLARVARVTRQDMPAEVVLTLDHNGSATPLGGVLGIGSRWTLGIGLPKIQALTIAELEASLAHEFGHYGGGDLWFLPLIAEAQAAMQRSFIIISPYGRMFRRIWQKIARVSEFAADRFAGETVGSEAVIGTLCASARISSIVTNYMEEDFEPALRAGFLPPFAEGFAVRLARPEDIAGMDQALANSLSIVEAEWDDSHPPLAQRIAAVKALPRGANPGNRPAVSLLRDLPALERELFKSIRVPKAKTLKPIVWSEVGVAVWLPVWETTVRFHAHALEGLHLQGLFNAAALNIEVFAAANPKHVLGAALACGLYRAGWTIDYSPGFRRLTKDGAVIAPFEIVDQMASGDLSREDWRNQMAALGLDSAMPLFLAGMQAVPATA